MRIASLTDIKLAWRGIRRERGSSLVIVATLAVALGASITLATVIEAVLLRPLPAREQQRLRMMWETDLDGERPLVEVSLPNFADWRDQSQSFENMAAVAALDWGIVFKSEGPPQKVGLRAVSASFFETLGVEALHGRTFLPEDDEPDAERVLVLSYGFWKTRLGGDPNAVGRVLHVEDPRGPATFTVAGIMPQSFQFPLGTDVWVPAGRQLTQIVRDADIDPSQLRGLGLFIVLGRLADNVEDDKARAELETIVSTLGDEYFGRHNGFLMVPLTDYIYGNVRTSLWLLSGAVAFLLLIACANVSALLLARILERRKSFWIRRALGAGAADLIKLAVSESFLLAVAGGLGGFLLTALSLPLVTALAPPDVPGLGELQINPSIWLFAGSAILLVTMAICAAPVWRIARSRGHSSRRLGAGAASLATLEIGGAVLLLIGAFLLTESFRALKTVDLGFRSEGVLTASVSPPASRYPEKSQRRAFFQRVIARAREIPSVAFAGVVQVAPLKMGAIGQDAQIRLSGQSEIEIEKNPAVNYHQASPGYFRAIGIDLVEGRTFVEHESMPVAIVSQNLATRLWPGESAIGKRLATGDPEGWLSVIGVVNDARYRELYRARLELYVHYLQPEWVTGGLTIALRTDTDPLALIAPLQAAVHELDPDQTIEDIASMDAVVAQEMAPWRFNAWMASVFASISAFLAVAGVFSLLARNVVARAPEFAIRMAVGATGGTIVQSVVSRALRWAAVGTSIGVVAAVGASRAMEAVLFGVSGTDIGVYATVAVTVIACCVAASLAPALFASRVEPSTLLRSE